MQLSENFSLEELIASEVAARSGIDNSPPSEILDNLRALAQGLELVRLALGNLPIHVNSGYRCPAVNARVGGAKNSAHMSGLAADILCPQFGSPLDVCRAIASQHIATDQIIHEFGRWCHVAFAAPGQFARNERLTIASSARGYEQGLNSVA
jgi:zinc D-Ala-D-Ala carboxypeptidase